MNVLTVETITFIGSQVHPTFIFHPTSIAYIQTLLTPYAEALEAAQDIAAITGWVPLAFTGRLGQHAMNEMRKDIHKYVTKHHIEEDAINTDPSVVAGAKTAVIEYIVSEITELSGQFVHGDNTTTILPWDVQTGIHNDVELAPLFGLVGVTTTLPVLVTIGPQSFQHMMTEEMAMGLLLFSTYDIIFYFQITMFGVPLLSDYYLLEDGNDRQSKYIYSDENQSEFRVIVNDSEYTFHTGDFMQGFHTGAIWTEVDHHDYWSELKTKLNQTNEWTSITF